MAIWHRILSVEFQRLGLYTRTAVRISTANDLARIRKDRIRHVYFQQHGQYEILGLYLQSHKLD